MRAPDFWWTTPPTAAARLLAPLGAVYGAATARRMARAGARLPVPVLCVGNLVAGGAGKTPAALALGRLLRAQGRRPAFLSRGYGRRGEGSASAVLRVDPDRHAAAEAGDEPLLLAREAPTFVCADRRRAAAAAISEGADCLILDDGLQNPALAKDWTLAVADGVAGIGNGLCVPAGPLRAPAARQWGAVSLLAVVGPGTAGTALAHEAQGAGVPVTGAALRPDPATLARWGDRPLFAFAGIGRPGKLFDTLRASGCMLACTRSFPDHHPFTPAELRALEREAAQAGALLITTAKDHVRLPPGFPAEVLRVELVFADEGALLASLPFSA